MSTGGTRISNVSVVSVAREESRKVVSVSISMKDECVSLPKPKSQLAQLHDDDEDVFATSVIDRYAARPLAFQIICLATFAVMYDVIQSSTKTGETEDVNTEEDMQNTGNTHTLTKMKLQKRIGCHQKEKTTGNIMYKKVQNPYRTRKIFSYNASLLPME